MFVYKHTEVIKPVKKYPNFEHKMNFKGKQPRIFLG